MIKFINNIRHIFKLLNFLTTINIALTVIIITSMLIFFLNANKLLKDWNKGLRIIAYISENASKKDIEEMKDEILKIKNTNNVYFLSKEKALEFMQKELKKNDVFFESLKINPLPNAFEVVFKAQMNIEKIKNLAEKIASIKFIEDVEYGQNWIDYFFKIFNMLKLIGVAVALFFIISCIFIVINTLQISFFSKKEDIKIMNLIGASTSFIGKEFYKQAAIQGFIGGLFGFFLTFSFFSLLKFWLLKNGILLAYNKIEFLPFYYVFIIVILSSLIGFCGCHFSLKQFLKK